MPRSAPVLTLAIATCGSFMPFIWTPPALADGPQIRWEIENRFRYFKKAADFRAIADVYNQIKTSQTPTPSVLALEKKLEEKATQVKFNGTTREGKPILIGWAAAIYKDTCGRQPDHTHSSCRMENGEPYLAPVVSMTANLILSGDGLGDATCEWRIDDAVVDAKPCNVSVLAKNVKYEVEHKLEVRPSGGTPLSIPIKLTDVLIASFGDSFSAGEGNPEKPVQLKDNTAATYSDSLPGYVFPIRVTSLDDADKENFLENTSADWSNVQCHRSLYSHHTRAALQYALENPHVSVTFLNYSCTGAEVYEGILNAWWGRLDVRRGGNDDAPQLVKALRDLCKDAEPYKERIWAIHGRYDPDYNTKAADIAPCDARVRDVDVLLLSIGGNDVGFANIIAGAELNGTPGTPGERARSWVNGLWRDEARPQSFDQGRQKALDLATRYKHLNEFVTKDLKVRSDRIILSAYPQVFYSEDGGHLCVKKNIGMDVHSIFGVKDVAVFSDGQKFVSYLHDKMEDAAKRQNWLFADQHVVKDGMENNFANDDKGLGHGICAAAPPGENDAPMKFPRPTSMAKLDWQPFYPASWTPYSFRYRWFVTPNDAFLTDNEHKRLWDLYDTAQPVYAATISGAFHPNALGQAAIADSVLTELRDVLGPAKN
jgi:hypothetical protein